MKVAKRVSIFVFLSLTISLVATTAKNEDNKGNVVRSIQDDFRYDENGKLLSNQLVYPDSSECSTIHRDPHYGFEYRPLSGEALREVFPNYIATGNKLDCPAACIERGVDKSFAGAVMPHKHYSRSNTMDAVDWFSDTCLQVEMCLINYHSKKSPIKVYWMNPQTNIKVYNSEIFYGEQKTRCISSYIGHKFVVEDGETGQLLQSFTVEHTLVLSFGESPTYNNPEHHAFDKRIESTLKEEWTRHNRIKRTFSPLGFKKGRLPNDVFASIGALFYNNRFNKVREEWGGKGVFVNWWETDCSFIQIPWQLKALYQERLRLLVGEWIGIPVEETMMYGLRQYEHGARLLTHVDRHETHAVSLIVNVAQGNLTEPWPVEVYDHADRLHEVIMEPGDIVYYESAKNLHGRNRPLMGTNAYYVNMFTHYRPQGEGNGWWAKDNHAGTPEPLLKDDPKGDCHLERFGTTATITGQLGMVEAVRCDDTRLGSSISPSLFTATSGDDLIDWWRSTAPREKNSGESPDNTCDRPEELP